MRIKTEEESPISSQKKVIGSIRPFSPQKKKSGKARSNDKFEKIYKQKMSELKKEPGYNNGKLLNFIDLSKDYSGELQ